MALIDGILGVVGLARAGKGQETTALEAVERPTAMAFTDGRVLQLTQDMKALDWEQAFLKAKEFNLSQISLSFVVTSPYK